MDHQLWNDLVTERASVAVPQALASRLFVQAMAATINKETFICQLGDNSVDLTELLEKFTVLSILKQNY
jgi:hypothetical protein